MLEDTPVQETPVQDTSVQDTPAQGRTIKLVYQGTVVMLSVPTEAITLADVLQANNKSYDTAAIYRSVGETLTPESPISPNMEAILMARSETNG